MRKTMVSRTFLFLLSVLTAIAIVPSEAEAQAPASNPAGLCKAGVAVFAVGQAGIFVNYPVPWPATVTYSVAVQPTNTAGYSPTGACTYFNVLKMTPTQFQVQHKLCDTGVPVPLDVAVSLDWIACPHQ